MFRSVSRRGRAATRDPLPSRRIQTQKGFYIYSASQIHVWVDDVQHGKGKTHAVAARPASPATDSLMATPESVGFAVEHTPDNTVAEHGMGDYGIIVVGGMAPPGSSRYGDVQRIL